MANWANLGAAGGAGDAVTEIIKQRLAQSQADQQARYQQGELDDRAAERAETLRSNQAREAIDQQRNDEEHALRVQTFGAAQQEKAIGDAEKIAPLVPIGPTDLQTFKTLSPIGQGRTGMTDATMPATMPTGPVGGTVAASDTSAPVAPDASSVGATAVAPRQVWSNVGTAAQMQAAQAKAKRDAFVAAQPPGSPVARDAAYEDAMGHPRPADESQLTPDQKFAAWKQQHDYEVAHPIKPPSDAPAQALLGRSYAAAAKSVDTMRKPLSDESSTIRQLNDTLNQNTPQADALVAPQLLKVMTGNVGRMSPSVINQITGGRSGWESLLASAQHWNTDSASANSITPAQRQQMRALISAVQNDTSARLKTLDDADQALIDAGSLGEHRQIVHDVKAKLDGGATGSASAASNDPLGIR
jgi:hypothetical protein